jgi:phosphoribosylanthranilate isomerase
VAWADLVMLTQIYEVGSAGEAQAISSLGVDHVGVLVGDGGFPREQGLPAAARIAASIRPPARLSALFLTADVALIAAWCTVLRPAILHLGASPELLSPDDAAWLKARLLGIRIMRSVPVTGEESLDIAAGYAGIADFLLLDSHRASDRQIGALGVTHDWGISRRIVEAAAMPVILAGGLGPDNVAEAIRVVRPAGVDSKTRTDRDGSHEKDFSRVAGFHLRAKEAAGLG